MNAKLGRWIRIAVAIVGGVIVCWLLLCEGLELGFAVGRFHWLEVTGHHDAIYRKFGDIYTSLSFIGLTLAGGASFAMFVIDLTRRRRFSVAFYWILLLVILPLSVANYWAGDFFAERWKQALLDGVLVFLGLVAVFRMVACNFSSVPARIAQALVVGLLALNAVLIPAAFGIIWLLNIEGVIKKASDADGWSPSWITAVTGVISLGVSILTFRHTVRKDTPPIQSPIIRL
jgi:hypothetical protein